MVISKDEMLKELGELMAKQNPGVKPKQARRSIAKVMKKASYDEWLELYTNTMKGGK